MSILLPLAVAPMTVIAAVTMAIMGLAILLGLLRIRLATDAGSRAVVGDLVFFAGIGLMMGLSVLDESSVIFDAAVLASMLGVLTTVALARIITRGQR